MLPVLASKPLNKCLLGLSNPMMLEACREGIKATGFEVKRRIETVLDNFSYTYVPKKYDIKKLKSVDNTYRIRIRLIIFP